MTNQILRKARKHEFDFLAGWWPTRICVHCGLRIDRPEDIDLRTCIEREVPLVELVLDAMEGES